MTIKHNIKATNIELTDAIRDYVVQKLGSFEKLIDSTDTSVQADIEVGKTTRHHKSGDVFRAEINLHIAGKYLRAVSKKEDLYAAIDDVKDEIIRRLRKEKTRRTSRIRRGALKLKHMLRRNKNKL